MPRISLWMTRTTKCHWTFLPGLLGILLCILRCCCWLSHQVQGAWAPKTPQSPIPVIIEPIIFTLECSSIMHIIWTQESWECFMLLIKCVVGMWPWHFSMYMHLHAQHNLASLWAVLFVYLVGWQPSLFVSMLIKTTATITFLYLAMNLPKTRVWRLSVPKWEVGESMRTSAQMKNL